MSILSVKNLAISVVLIEIGSLFNCRGLKYVYTLNLKNQAWISQAEKPKLQ